MTVRACDYTLYSSKPLSRSNHFISNTQEEFSRTHPLFMRNKCKRKKGLALRNYPFRSTTIILLLQKFTSFFLQKKENFSHRKDKRQMKLCFKSLSIRYLRKKYRFLILRKVNHEDSLFSLYRIKKLLKNHVINKRLVKLCMESNKKAVKH